MRHRAQPHGSGQPSTALERVQAAQQFVAGPHVARPRHPLAQRGAQPWQQFGGLFLEDGKEVGVDHVARIDLVVDVLHGGRLLGRQHVGKAFLRLLIRPGRIRGFRSGTGIRRRHLGFGVQDGAQLVHQLRVRLLEKTGGELVQQTADVFGRGDEHGGLLGYAVRLPADMFERMLQRARHLGQRGKPHGGRAARQRMRQRHRHVRQRLMQLQRPFLQRGGQPARPFVGLVQIDVVERYPDAQRADDLDGFVGLRGFQGFCGLRCLLRCAGFQQIGSLHRSRLVLGHGQLGRQRLVGGLCLRGDRRCGLDGSLFGRLPGIGRLHGVSAIQWGGGGVRNERLRLLDSGQEGFGFSSHGLDRISLHISHGRLVHPLFSLRARLAHRIVGLRRHCGIRRFNGLHEVGEIDLLRHLLRGPCLGSVSGPSFGCRHAAFFARGHGGRLGSGGVLLGRARQPAAQKLRSSFGQAWCSTRHPQRLGRLAGTQRTGRIHERLGLPAAVVAGSDGVGPAAEGLQALFGEVQQIGRRGFLLGQPGVQGLLHRPRGIAERRQADHARTALEGVEGAAQRGLLAQVARCGAQALHGGEAGGDDFARLVEEDVQQLLVFVVRVGQGLHRGQRLGRQRHGGGQGFGRALLGRKVQRVQVQGEAGIGRLGGLPPRLCRLHGHGGRFRFRGGRRHFGQGLGLHRCRLCRRGGLRCRFRRALLLLRLLRTVGKLAGTAHAQAQLALHLVIDEELARHGALVAQHVDQKAQRAQAVAELLEQRGPLGLLHLAGQQPFHRVAHAQRGQRGLVQPQHRQHAAHLRQPIGHGGERGQVFGLAEELVHGLFGLGQGGTQLAHHAAHGLMVADPAVELLHPRLQRSGLAACRHMVQPLRQLRTALGQMRLRGVGLLEGGLQVEHRGGDFHRQIGGWHAACAAGRIDRAGQRARQRFAARVQPGERIADQAELVGRRLVLAAVSAGKSGPGLRRRGDTPPGLRQHGRVVTAEARLLVIDRRGRLLAERLLHGMQWRGAGSIACGHAGLGAEKEQVLHQPVGDGRIAPGEGCVLHEHARGDALDVHIGRQAPGGEGVEKAGAELPERAWLALGIGGGQAQADIAHLAGGRRIAMLDDAQHGAVEAGASCGAVGQRRFGQRHVGLAQVALHGPEIGRMHALGARQRLHIAVLGKKTHRRGWLAGQYQLQVFDQGKARAFEHGDRVLAALVGALHELLHGGFHRPQHQCGPGHADHLQRAAGLVQLLARHAQRAGIERCEVGFAGHGCLAHKAAQRFERAVERLAQLFVHPGERP